MKSYTVYKYTNIKNGKVYIGTTTLPLQTRSGRNGKNYKVCPRFWEGIQADGWESFKREVLEQRLTKEEAGIREAYYISKYESNTLEKGYNIQKGGFSLYEEDNTFYGKTHSDEARKAVADANRRRIWTEESKAKSREKLSGDKSSAAKAIVCLETNKVYSCIKYAAQESGATSQNICNVLHGRHKTAGGFHWAYANS